jgi:hypothetical protein
VAGVMTLRKLKIQKTFNKVLKKTPLQFLSGFKLTY